MLTLSQKSYLAELISTYWKELDNKSYEIASEFTEPQRNLFLKLTRQGRLEEAKEIVENVLAFKTKII